MAGRRTGGGKSRMDLRREADAVEAREKPEDEEVEDDDEDGDDEDEDGEEDAEAEEVDGEVDEAVVEDEADDEDDDDDEDGPKKKKKKKVVKVKKVAAPKKKRVKAVKIVRQRATWVVFDNSSKRVGAFPYAQKAEAEALMTAKMEEKKTTFFIQLIKEPIEE